jgi:hypothetical protein
MDCFETMFAPTILGMFISNKLPVILYIPIYDLSLNQKYQILPKTGTPHSWCHNARKVALTLEMWCRPD